ncbi:unnamed protein product [Pneumocystis jirovecii]|uniref:Vps41 beta-propeller domain-containing protein n=1 Tax=Pneumocystis jirovecii TaxID=42068 RepID=L0PBV8_PNEJI|nr:unnamed protein product [Pneumocystis jirovecii]
MNDFIDKVDNEPYLKYTRISGVASEIFSKEFISTFEISSNILVLGSHNGYLYIININNDELSQHHIHSASISDLSIDDSGEYIATASIDGSVALYTRSNNNITLYNYRRPVKSVAIDPNYSQNFRIISGWLGNKDTVLHYGEGPIYEIQWYGNMIAWANDMGVKIYSTLFSQRISFIQKIPDSPRPDLFRCRLVWSSFDNLLIGWANYVTVVTIKSPDFNHRLPYSEISLIIKLDYIVSGIAKFEDKLLVLAFISDINSLIDTEITTRPAVECPELRLINSKNEEISGEALNLQEYSKFQANDFNLRLCPKKKSIYVIGPNDGIIAKERELKDHLLWLIKHKYYEKAINIVEKLQEPIEDEYDKISSISQSIFGHDVDLWEKWILNFIENGHLQSITPYIPTNSPQLSSFVYETIISYYLVSNQELLFDILKNWPFEIYNIDNIISVIKDRWEQKGEKILMECLADLYIKKGSPKDALYFYLHLKSPKTINLIKQYRLFDNIQDNILLLFQLDTFSNKIEDFSEKTLNDKVHKVIDQLEGYHMLQYRYLRAIFLYNNYFAPNFGDLQVELYAEYDRNTLMEFLRTSYTYSLEKAYKVCELRDYIPEQVFILGRMGNNKKALILIIEKLNDVDQAIEFAKIQKDDDLWEDLIIYSLNNPIFICRLLENAGSAIDPIKFIKRIPEGLVIPCFKESLSKILKEYELQTTLVNSAYKINSMEVSSLYKDFLRNQKRGILINVKFQKCNICNEHIIKDGIYIYIFVNKLIHLYHIDCILEKNQALSAVNVFKENNISVGIRNTTAPIIQTYLKECPLCYNFYILK